MAKKLKRFWISWNQMTADKRPLKDPPQPKNICAWWCSGEGDGYFTLCAIVEAESEQRAEEYIQDGWQSNNGKEEVGEFRFNSLVEDGWLPNDRFPITKDWEKERLGI